MILFDIILSRTVCTRQNKIHINIWPGHQIRGVTLYLFKFRVRNLGLRLELALETGLGLGFRF